MIGEEPPKDAVAPLPVVPTIVETLRTVFGNLPLLATICAVPMLLSLLTDIATVFVEPPWAGLVRSFALELPWTLMGVVWLRWILQVDRAAGPGFFPALERRHLRFLGYSILLTCIDLPLMFFSTMTGDAAGEEPLLSVLFWAIYFVAVYVEMRFSFVYVAAAVDEKYSLGLAWRHSRGSHIGLFLALGLTVLLPWRLLNYVLEELSAGQADLLLWLLWHLGFWLAQALYLTVIALAFRICTGWVPAPDRRLIERFE